MKKVFLPLVAAACTLVASAQLIPNTFNYQGVCDVKSDAITVKFEVKNDQAQTVYQEEETVLTEANGSFTAVIGDGNAASWNNIDWAAGEYTVVTYINNNLVSNAPLHAVPYANVASYVVGLDETQQDVLELVEDNMSNKAAIAQLQQDFALVGDNLEMLVPVIDTLLENVGVIDEGLGITQQDVLELVEDNMSNKAAIAQLQVDLNNVVENLEMAAPALENLDAIIAGLDGTEQTVLELVEDNMSNKAAIAQIQVDLYNVIENLEMAAPALENLDAIIAGLDGTEQTIIELVEDNMSNKAAIAQIQQDNANVTENLEMLVPIIDTLLENVDVLNDGLAITQQDVLELVEDNMSNKAAIAQIETSNANVMENLEMLVPIIDTLLENVDVLQDGLAITQQDVLELVEDNMSNKAGIAQLQQDLNELALSYEGYTKDLEETLAESFGETHDRIIALEEGLGITQQDVLELVEDNMSNKAGIAQLQQDFALVGENLEMLVPVVDTLLENVDVLNDGLAITQQDVIELTEATKSNTAGVADLYQSFENANENMQKLSEVIDYLLEKAEALEELEGSYEQYTKDLEETLAESFGETYDRILALEEGLAISQQDIIELTEATKSNTAGVADLYQSFENANENLQKVGEVIDYLLEGVEANADAIEIVSSDLQGVVESLRGKANVDEVNAALDVLRRMIEDNAAAISALSAVNK